MTRSRDLLAAEVRAAFAEMVRGRSPWPLTLWGQPGVGKTCAALTLLDWTCWHQPKDPQGQAVHRHCYWTVGEFMRLSWAAMFGRIDGLTEFELRKQIEQAGLVVLDELDRVMDPKESRKEAVVDLVDWRHARPLVLISNVPPDQLAEIYHPRLVSRMMAGTVLEMTGADRRVAH